MNVSVRALSERPEFTGAAGGLDGDIGGVYICDLLSWAMAKVSEGDVWLTVQGHVNVIAVAALTGAACVVVCDGAALEPEAAEKANARAVPVLTTALSAYAAAKLLASLEA